LRGRESSGEAGRPVDAAAGGAAGAFAALLARRYAAPARNRLGIVVSGGNTTTVDFAR
jgi:hypothetical protein